MIRVKIGGQVLGIPTELIAPAIMSNLPKWLTGDEPTQGMTQAAIKSGVKGLIPLLLGLLHKDIERKGLPLVPPDLKCREAKQNIVRYAVAYLMANAASLAEHQVFVAEGEMRDGAMVLTGLSAAPAALESPRDDSTADGDRPALASPLS
jgi:hypothetical protein